MSRHRPGRLACFLLALWVAGSRVTQAAIAFVQDDVGHNSATTSLAVAFTSNVTAGNAIVLLLKTVSTVTISSIVDTLGHTYVLAQENDAQSMRTGLYRVVNISGGANTVTITVSASSSVTAVVLEYSGMATSGELDQSNFNSGASATSGNHGSITTTVGDGIIISVMGFGGNPGTITGTSGWTARQVANVRQYPQDKITSATETTSGAITWATAQTWNGVIANFAAAGGAPAAPKRLMLLGVGDRARP